MRSTLRPIAYLREDWTMQLKSRFGIMLACLLTVLGHNLSAQTSYFANFQTSGGYYLVAENGGADYVDATRTSPGPWETFEVIDVWDGSLEHGDEIRVRVYSGHYWTNDQCSWVKHERLSALGSSGSPSCWISFVIAKVGGSGGSAINSGDQVAICSNNGCAAAENGGGWIVNVNRYSIGPWETFTITY